MMKPQANPTLFQQLNAKGPGTALVGAVSLLCANLVLAVYLSMVFSLKICLILGLNFPVNKLFLLSTGTALTLLGAILALGIVTLNQLLTVDRTLRHALHSVREGDLSTRIDLKGFEGCGALEQAFNDTMEVVQHRIEKGQSSSSSSSSSSQSSSSSAQSSYSRT